MQIKWLEEAIFDLQSLRQYISQDNPQAANKIAKRILQAVNLLLEQPNIGRPGRILETRELVVTNTPFIIPYRIKHNNVEILRVLHGAMQWPENFTHAFEQKLLEVWDNEEDSIYDTL